ncbi:hypothetical protein AAW14_36555 [Streptomyces hygroscopicus]|uniref:pentapeptide repeat-containing protein n=1 Tax=Streptomyces hygroscopicus TaxID=1912 RepID=UPI0022402AAE|nr:pentapeptide repeat-containing protein [Streptomyces hygroscopicus]MCW7947319.1 hypothetical protein [Streptomyces hygroscopicus]
MKGIYPDLLPAAFPWQHCGRDADPATDPAGCPGILVPGNAACLAHVRDADRIAYLHRLRPGADIDHRGTPFTERVLSSLLDALREPPITGDPQLGRASFEGASFTDGASFAGATFNSSADFRDTEFAGEARAPSFHGAASFDGVTFNDNASFVNVKFTGGTSFANTMFNGKADFDCAEFYRDPQLLNGPSAVFLGATFNGVASFMNVWFSDATSFADTTFNCGASFWNATFTQDPDLPPEWMSSVHAWFNGAVFTGGAWFQETKFTGGVSFSGARFKVAQLCGPMACQGKIDLSEAVFEAPVTLQLAAREVSCVRTRWESTAALRLHYATLNLSDAVLSGPLSVTAPPAPSNPGDPGRPDCYESMPTPLVPDVRVGSVRGVDAAHLVLADTDLTSCLFSGAFHLDQLRLEGRCRFARPPTGFHRRSKIWPYRWSPRRTLAEEHHWRAQRAQQSGVSNPDPPGGWYTPSQQDSPGCAPGPESLAATYRQLRKAFEDSKNEPGAADFYYGEMEMRRHDRTGTPTSERGLLWAYWLVSGYGLRVLRALLWLVGAMAVTALALMAWGLPARAPLPSATGTLAGHTLTLSTNSPDVTINGQLMTLPRADRAIRVVMNSVIFRTAGQNLTPVGAYIEMASRIFEPILLLLVLLAVRNRVKR